MSTYIAEHLLFSIFPSILTFNYDPIDGPFLAFWAQMAYFRGWGFVGGKMFCGLLIKHSWGKNVLWSTHKAQQLLFSMFPLILTFDFCLNFWVVLAFLGPNVLFLWLGQIKLKNFYFLCFLQLCLLFLT